MFVFSPTESPQQVDSIVPPPVNHSNEKNSHKVLFCSNKNSQNVQAIANNELHKVSKWFCSNKLSLSFNKTKYMILSKSKTNEPFSVKINGFEIVQTHGYKYLGVIIDDKLKWHDHITYICRKIFKFSGLFYRIRRIAVPALPYLFAIASFGTDPLIVFSSFLSITLLGNS